MRLGSTGFPHCDKGPQMEWLTTDVCCLAALEGSKIKGSAPAWSPEKSPCLPPLSLHQWPAVLGVPWQAWNLCSVLLPVLPAFAQLSPFIILSFLIGTYWNILVFNVVFQHGDVL